MAVIKPVLVSAWSRERRQSTVTPASTTHAPTRGAPFAGLADSGGLNALPLPYDKRPESGQALRDFALFCVPRHALIVTGDPEHLIARILHLQPFRCRAALPCPVAASSAFRNGDR